MKERKKIFVAMSGGVDSSVAAALLVEQGHDVVGVFMRGWTAPGMECNWGDEQRDAMRVAAELGIPFKTYDFSREYEEHVVSYLLSEYKEGRTPNPDVMCNRDMKFGLFLDRARAEGADMIATGHYARVWQCAPTKIPEIQGLRYFVRRLLRRDNAHAALCKTDEYQLLAGRDGNKDQSYFLWTLTQEQLQYILFPVGEINKPHVRKLAHKFNLPVADKKDSQGVCFVGELNMGEFLRMHLPLNPGKVVTTKGKVVGEHDGLAFYTIGQRHGLGIGGGTPYYVAEKNQDKNELIVAENPQEEQLSKKSLVINEINRIAECESPSLRVLTRIRYRQNLEKATIKFSRKGDAKVTFDDPQWAVAPGQSVVFYDLAGEVVLGGGVIV